MGFEEGPHLERVRRNDNRRWPLLAIGLGIALIALAALQPWSILRPASDSQAARDSTSIASTQLPGTAVPSARASDGLFPQCNPSLSWRVASLQQQESYKVRTAWPVSTVPQPAATGSTTPTLSGVGVEAIGFCTPGRDDLTRAQYVGDVSLWRRAQSGAVVMVDGAGVLYPELAAQGEVYLTPPAPLALNGAWPPGDYYFQVRPRGATVGRSAPGLRWFSLRIAQLQGLGS